MSIHNGQRMVSIRKRMLAYCEQHGIDVPSAFHDQDPVLAIALVRIFTPGKSQLVAQTFYSTASALDYLKQQNKHPENYRFLDFKRGVEWLIDPAVSLKAGPDFDNRRDVDVQR
jgi:hypothetical protein